MLGQSLGHLGPHSGWGNAAARNLCVSEAQDWVCERGSVNVRERDFGFFFLFILLCLGTVNQSGNQSGARVRRFVREACLVCLHACREYVDPTSVIVVSVILRKSMQTGPALIRNRNYSIQE